MKTCNIASCVQQDPYFKTAKVSARANARVFKQGQKVEDQDLPF